MATSHEGPEHFFKEANEALLRREWDLAIELLNQAIELAPDNELYRQVLRGVQEQKARFYRPALE